jgi:hypothetical protein
MMKIIIVILTNLFSCYYSFSQGNLRLSAFKNETGLLQENVLLDSVMVDIYLLNTGADKKKTFTFTNSEKNCFLHAGLYNIELKISTERIIKICNVLIRDSELTFVDILIEPAIELTKRELRQRKKFHNYRKTSCD